MHGARRAVELGLAPIMLANGLLVLSYTSLKNNATVFSISCRLTCNNLSTCSAACYYSSVGSNVWGYANTASVHCMRFFRQLKQHLKVSTASVQNVQDYANVLPIYSVVFRR